MCAAGIHRELATVRKKVGLFSSLTNSIAETFNSMLMFFLFRIRYWEASLDCMKEMWCCTLMFNNMEKFLLSSLVYFYKMKHNDAGLFLTLFIFQINERNEKDKEAYA